MGYMIAIFMMLKESSACKQGRSEELAQATEEQHDGHSPSTSTSPSLTGSGGNGAPAATPASTTSDVVAYMENYDSSIPTLNTAVMMYHLQQYADGMSVLEPLYRNIEPIDEVCSKLLWISCAFWQLHLCFPCGV
jgi:hypothetical protein